MTGKENIYKSFKRPWFFSKVISKESTEVKNTGNSNLKLILIFLFGEGSPVTLVS